MLKSWAQLHTELVFLKLILLKNDYPESFISKCFIIFMNKRHVVKETILIVEKKPFVLALPYLG